MLSQWLAWRLRLPAILFLLLSGIVAGPLLGWLDPDEMFGPLLFPLVSLAVALILFEGSLTLHFSEWKEIDVYKRQSQPLEEVLAVLARAEVPASRIYSAEDMFRDPQFLAREMFLSARLPDGKPFRMPGIVPKLSATPGSADWVGPELGEHTDALLAELGYDSEGIAALRREGAI